MKSSSLSKKEFTEQFDAIMDSFKKNPWYWSNREHFYVQDDVMANPTLPRNKRHYLLVEYDNNSKIHHGLEVEISEDDILFTCLGGCTNKYCPKKIGMMRLMGMFPKKESKWKPVTKWMKPDERIWFRILEHNHDIRCEFKYKREYHQRDKSEMAIMSAICNDFEKFRRIWAFGVLTGRSLRNCNCIKWQDIKKPYWDHQGLFIYES